MMTTGHTEVTIIHNGYVVSVVAVMYNLCHLLGSILTMT